MGSVNEQPNNGNLEDDQLRVEGLNQLHRVPGLNVRVVPNAQNPEVHVRDDDNLDILNHLNHQDGMKITMIIQLELNSNNEQMLHSLQEVPM